MNATNLPPIEPVQVSPLQDVPLQDTTVESILHIAWRFPLWLLIVVALIAGAMVWWLYWTERGKGGKVERGLLATIRFMLLMLVLWMLSGWSWLRFKSDQPELIVVIDRSASMNTRDVGSDAEEVKKTRVARAIELFQKHSRRELEQLQQLYQLQWFTVAESLEPISASEGEQFELLSGIVADGTQSRLGEGLVRLLQRQAGKGTAAVIFVSDGVNTSGTALAEAAKAARRAAVPVFTVAVGRQTELPDLRLADLLVDRQVYLGDQVTAEVALVVSDVPTAETRIQLRDMATNQILDETRVVVSSQQRQVTARLSFVPERAGQIALRLEASPIAGEKVLDNNTLDTVVEVQDKTIRVLLVSEIPSYEFRFLKNFLERAMQTDASDAASFELQTVLQVADPMYVDQDPTALRLVPSQSESIAEYDVFVFVDFDPQLITQTSQQAIVDAVVRHGAGWLLVTGRGSPARALEGWPLAKLLPIERSGAQLSADPGPPLGQLRWQPTALGSSALPMQLAGTLQESLAVWQRLPDFAALSRVEQVRSGAQVLSQAVDRHSGQAAPLLVTQFAGAGRSALQASDETYRWTSFLGSDLYYQRYWGQLLRWLSRGKLSGQGERLELLIEPKQASVGQPIRFQLTLAGEVAQLAESAAVELAIEGHTSRDKTITLTRVNQATSVYQATVTDLQPGSYRAVLLRPLSEQPPSEDFSITAPPGEQAVLRANVAGMRQLAEQSRGRFYVEEQAQRMFDDLPPGKPTRLGPLPSQPIWNAWWVALLFVGLITSEWLLRRRCQML
jgi:hypothetical protein